MFQRSRERWNVVSAISQARRIGGFVDGTDLKM
jgi:hypothetical protein